MNYKILSVVTFIIAVTPAIVFAQTPPPPFRVLVGIPGIDPNNTNMGQYINALYILSISIAALLAVIKIIIAGVKYMLSDVVTSKAEAKSDIQGALIGLLIVISAVVILETINPQLRTMSFFENQHAAQVPGRPVRDTPTASGAAPLPGLDTTAGRETIPCEQNSAGVANCAAAADSCYSKNGRLAQSIKSNTRSITCVYGETNTIDCKAIPSNQTATQQQEPDCTEANQKCLTRDPNIASTPTPAGEYQISCFTPYPPKPQVSPTAGSGS
jgi:hypothetical protein